MAKIVYKIEMELDLTEHDLQKIHEMGIKEFSKQADDGLKQFLEFELGGEDCRVTKVEGVLVK